MAWEKSNVVALDSQGVIQRIQNLQLREPRSWIEERCARQMAERSRVLMWVRGHTGKEGNEMADTKAKMGVWIGERMHKPDSVTLAGIRQAYSLHDKAPKHLGGRYRR